MTTSNSNDFDYTRPLDLPGTEQDANNVRQEPVEAETTVYSTTAPAHTEVISTDPPIEAPRATPSAPPTPATDVVYVPLAVTLGDGFKFGCGFFLSSALVTVLLIVLIAALFAASTFLGLSVPLGR